MYVYIEYHHMPKQAEISARILTEFRKLKQYLHHTAGKKVNNNLKTNKRFFFFTDN